MDEKFMERCLELAQGGAGYVAPNPLVGSVIVCENRIIGEGYHRKYGEYHAEVIAINSVQDKSALKDSTIYINLEPCSFFGKTPPCADKIIEKKIPRVVIGTIDTSTKINGRGIKKLRDAGCEVITGVLEKKCREINKRFFCFHEKQRPYIILKWAKTKDGFVDVIRKKNIEIQPIWITNDLSRTLVHKWRSEEESILIGRKTAIIDNPRLNVREWSGNNPLRMVFDRNLRLKNNLNIFDGKIKTLVFTEIEIHNEKNLEYIKIDFSDSLNAVFRYLYNRKILSVIVEGGPYLHNAMITKEIWDEARVFTGDIRFGAGVKSPELNARLVSEEWIGSSRLQIYKPF